VGEKYETSADSLLAKTTDGIFQYLGRERQKRLRRLVRENILKKIADYWKERQPGITLVGDRFAVTWTGAPEKEIFLNRIEDRRIRFDAGKENLPLFDWVDAETKGV
jgi:hypothetical protein